MGLDVDDLVYYVHNLLNQKGVVMKFSHLLCVTVVFLSAACGGGDDETNVIGVNTDAGGASLAPQIDLTGSFDFFGFIDVFEDRFTEKTKIQGGFQRFTETQDAAIFINSIPQVADTCSGRVTTSIPTDAGVIGLPEAQFMFVNGGDVLKLEKDGADFVDVPTEGSGSFQGNGTDDGEYPIDADLVLQIPGDVFPAFADVPMPDPVNVEGFSPFSNDPISADTVFTWTPGSGHNGTIFFSLVGIGPNSTWVEVKCRPLDDGNFEFTDDLKAMLNSALPAGWEIEGLDVKTETVTVVSANNALLVATRKVD